MRKRTLGMGIVLAALAPLSLAVPAAAGTAGAPGAAKEGLAGPAVGAPGVLPPQSRPHGASYGQWGARWWQWLYQTPAESGTTQNQVLNNGAAGAPVAVNCALGQSGHVWFIGGALEPTSFSGGTLSFTAFRTCSIPTGTFLFFPVINSEFDNLTSVCVTTPPTLPFTTFTADELTAAADGAVDDIVPNTMTATIDDKSVSGLANSSSLFRSPSPSFSFTLPADNVGTAASGCPPSVVFKAGAMPPPPGAAADGIYLLLAPLSAGVHHISFGGTVDVPSSPTPALPLTPVVFTLDINYTITVVPRGHFPS